MSLRIQVTRGERYDIAEWTDAPLPPGGGAPPPPEAPEPLFAGPRLFAIVASLAIIAATALIVGRAQRPEAGRPLTPTVADLQAVHAGVTVTRSDEGASEARLVRRLAEGDAVATDGEGRARLRLDDGTAIVIDRGTRLSLRPGGLDLERGRLFVQGALGARAEIGVGGAVAVLSGADAGIERTADGGAKIYASRGELTVRGKQGESTVRAGDTATIRGDAVQIAPEKGFDDWTFGMAVPWGARGAPRRAVGELWGRPTTAPNAEIGAPLTIRAHDVHAVVGREIAETEVRTTFFNAGSEAVTGDFRMATPPGAIVSRFATARGEAVAEGRAALASRTASALVPQIPVLEWAGEGWVRGSIPSIPPGATVTVIVGWIEWLSPAPRAGTKNLVVQYRYPMVSDAAPPQIGEFSARIDATPSRPASIGAGFHVGRDSASTNAAGLTAAGPIVELRRPDFRPTADLVVEVEIPPWEAPARLYVAPPDGDDAGATILVRTETPPPAKDAGVTLALLLDASASVEPALLDAGRALVSAVVAGLGSRDRVVVLAADQGARPVGPAALGPVDAARRKAIEDGLATLSPGGATDLGRAFEAAADALPSDAPGAMVIYVGDGWPTIGDGGAPEILARLARRAGGPPRLGAVAVGPLANRWTLAALARGSGPLLEIADATDAPRAAVGLLAEALQPTAAGVEIVLGPEVERIYPRAARALVSGETAFAVGRVRGELPKEITLRWRDADGAHEERRALEVPRIAGGGDLGGAARVEDDVRRRWAAARVEEIALGGKGREAATDVALRAGLLTPWTGWLIGGGGSYVPTPLATRILDLASDGEAGSFSAVLATPRGTSGTLTDTLGAFGDDADDDGADAGDKELQAAVSAAAGRVIQDAGSAVRACRDSRAALRPDLAGSLAVSLEVDGDGRADDVGVRGLGGADDAALARCVEVVVQGLVFPASGLGGRVKVSVTIELPPPRATLRGRKCSPTSTLPLPLRRGVWRERLDREPHAAVYLGAKQTCELPTWTDRRALLELILSHAEAGLHRVNIARQLEHAGEADAAALLRREAIRRAKSPDELRRIKQVLIGDERYPEKTFRKQYRAAATDAARLGVVRRFLALAPHDARLRLRLLSLIEALGMKQELADEVRRIRRDPFAEASLLAEGASALRRIGDEAEARRAFGELAERAPSDPWARAFLGDRLRNEGWFDDAAAAYTVLEHLVSGDPAAALRLSLAHAGSGRLDVAQRTLARVAQTGGRAGDAKMGDLAGRVAAALLAEARARPGLGKDDEGRVVRAALELPSLGGATIVLVRSPAAAAPVEAVLVRGPKDARERRAAEIAAPSLGLSSLRIDPGDTSELVLELKRAKELPPARPTKVRVDALVPGAKGEPPRIASTEVDLPANGDKVELAWNGSAWAAR